MLNMRLRKIRMTFLVLCVCMLAVSLTGCGNALKAGIKQMESGDYQKAAESFQKVIDKGEDTKEVYRGLGMALYEQGDYAGALSALQTGLDNGMEETPQMYNLMGLSAMETGVMQVPRSILSQGLLLPMRGRRGDHRRRASQRDAFQRGCVL